MPRMHMRALLSGSVKRILVLKLVKEKKGRKRKKKRRKMMGPNSPSLRIQPVMPYMASVQAMKNMVLTASGIESLSPETVAKANFSPGAIESLPERRITVVIHPWMLCCDSVMKWLPNTSKMEEQAQLCSSTSVPSGDYQGRKGTNICDPPDIPPFSPG
jgi:hypothetical protein